MSQNVAQWMIQQLKAWGVKSVYGVLGNTILPFVDALNNDPEINFYSVKHETTAAFMASAEAKLSGSLGVCFATGGPGIANLVNGLADANSDCAPVLAITGQVETFNIGSNTKQYIDQSTLLTPVVTYSGIITTPQSCNDVFVKALRTATAKGLPTHVAVSKDIWSMPCSEPIRFPEPFLKTTPQSTPEIIDEAAKLLNSATKPAILAGRGIKEAKGLVLDFAEKWVSGVSLTMPAKGMLPGKHPLVMGGLGEGGTEASAGMLGDADLILIIGATWWPDKFVPQNTRIIQIDAEPTNIGQKMSVEFGLVGDITTLLPIMMEKLEYKPKPKWQTQLNSLKAKWAERIAPEINTSTDKVAPAYLIKTLEKNLAKDAIITIDVGDHAVWFNRIFEGDEQTILVSGNWRTMGFGFPAALSAKIAYPDRQVVALVGDGGFTQYLGEFLTAIRYQIPITVVIMNNGYLAMEKDELELEGTQSEVASLTNLDYAKFAELCGGRGYRVDSNIDLNYALSEAFQSNQSTIVDVITEAILFPGLREKVLRS